MSAYIEDLTIYPLDPGADPFDAPIPDANGRSTEKVVRVLSPPTCRVRVNFLVSEKMDTEELVSALRKFLQTVQNPCTF